MLIEKSDNLLLCCSNPEIIPNNEGLWVCQNCGLTFGQIYADCEQRAYSEEEMRSRRRTEPRWRSFGPRTLITNVHNDAMGHPLEIKAQVLFNRLSKIQGSLINGIERNFWEARPKLTLLVNKLHIPGHIEETAWKIYAEVARQKLTMGRSIEDFVAASLYAAIRIHEFSCLLEELTEIAMIPLRSVHRALGLLFQRVLPILKLNYRPITLKSLIFYLGNALNISFKTQSLAVDYFIHARKLGLKIIGKDPKGIAAAVIYIAGGRNGENRTQAKIAKATCITEVTLRKNVKDIQHLLSHFMERGIPTVPSA